MVEPKIIVDTSTQGTLKDWRFGSEEAGDGLGRWSVSKRILSGGRQQGVEVIEVDNGALKFTVVPSRGCNVWTGCVGPLRLGWDSPVKEVVHPRFVNLTERGGLGWLNGFGEWISRCGLESMGAPCQDGKQPLTLHGRINYLPASYVEVRYEPGEFPRLVVRGIVEETLMFGPQLRLTTEISTEIGTRTLVFEDTVENLTDAPQEMQSLYHINFGPPLLGPGAEFLAPVKKVAPMNARAAEGAMKGWNVYTGPHEPGYTEQVYLVEPFGSAQGETEVMLKSGDGLSGAVVSFNLNQLPCLTLWKQEGPLKSGYVTGLEPATSYPYPKPVERAAGRVPKLGGGKTHHARVGIRVLVSKDEVRQALARIEDLQQATPQVAQEPLE
ncbi:MAG TPA: aldose 1-epimerase family protein, partial [Chthoniobacterales bacterium]